LLKEGKLLAKLEHPNIVRVFDFGLEILLTMLTKTQLKLMDLGSAARFDSESIERFGSPGYIAPELFDSNEIAAKCDIFSMGMLLFETLTGSTPLLFNAKRGIASSK
jgi:serine/threonine protein kinase